MVYLGLYYDRARKDSKSFLSQVILSNYRPLIAFLLLPAQSRRLLLHSICIHFLRILDYVYSVTSHSLTHASLCTTILSPETIISIVKSAKAPDLDSCIPLQPGFEIYRPRLTYYLPLNSPSLLYTSRLLEEVLRLLYLRRFGLQCFDIRLRCDVGIATLALSKVVQEVYFVWNLFHGLFTFLSLLRHFYCSRLWW